MIVLKLGITILGVIDHCRRRPLSKEVPSMPSRRKSSLELLSTCSRAYF